MHQIFALRQYEGLKNGRKSRKKVAENDHVRVMTSSSRKAIVRKDIDKR